MTGPPSSPLGDRAPINRCLTVLARLTGTAAVALTRLAHRLGTHIYLSTGCLHGDHAYCQGMTGLAGAKRPGECKHCAAKCACGCHRNARPRAERATPLHCVCGDPVEWWAGPDGSAGWVHSPGSDTACLHARPRCPACQMPHDLTPDSLPATVCASTRQRIADAERAHAEGNHGGCCWADCDALQAISEEPGTREVPLLHTMLGAAGLEEKLDLASRCDHCKQPGHSFEDCPHSDEPGVDHG